MSDRDGQRTLAEWFRQWRVPLRKFLVGKGTVPAADLEDVAQEVFLRLLRYDRTEVIEHPQAYLYKMASNVAAEWAIRWRYSRPHDPAWLSGLLASDQPEQNCARGEAENEIQRAINMLSPRQRAVLKLQFAEGLCHAEIAERLGATQRSVKRLLSKSYERLRHELDQELLGVITDGRE
jgi:RNA polymerase sigma-70 factor (ECF subfamily)